jgi:hypothetical protein
VIISTFTVHGHRVRIGNDQAPGEPASWKTSVDQGIWTPGLPTLGEAIQHAIDSLGPPPPEDLAPCAECGHLHWWPARKLYVECSICSCEGQP